MKIIAAADIHEMDRCPGGRTDDSFLKTELDKLKWIVGECVVNQAALLISGDIFDKAITSISLATTVAGILGMVPRHQVYFVPGQHDLPYHVESHYKNSSLALLEHFEVAQRVKKDQPLELADGILVHGAGWGEPFPELSDEFDDYVNILLTHRMVIKDKLLWPGQTGYSKAAGLLRKHPDFDIIISGDNHQSFTAKHKGRILINPGSMLRLTRAQAEHEPRVYLIDTDEMEFVPLRIPIVDSNLDVGLIPKAGTVSEDLQRFVTELTEARTGHAQVDFMDHIRQALESRRVKKPVKVALKAIMEKCNAA